ncbi:MAG: hypothetical protein RMZ41_001705 [Nostoc sp. DedVER02]|uniref:hypothetical protein n=1 Tax=unclassified Nostoc TaxID=2593658 RepID=UPI002AD2F977|nr:MULTISPECIES: hypothetical protein [unclassified Nostoc]MDZ7987125.1 hypothetical protein [Nostoc sp. DedVER02]MDZ8111005.1 hypothetical protein [Nostoc sp. DedVER01b]
MATNGNNITIVLNAKDNASGVFKGLTGLIEGATLRANLLSNALSAGLSKGVSALTSKFKEAADIQLNNISAASTYAALTGRNFADAEKVFSNLDGRINKIAAALPGSTEEYKKLALGIQDNLIPAFVDANGVFNEGAFLDGLTNITRGLGFLGAASNVSSKDVSKFTSKFLGGSSISELEKLLFAESNPAFLSLVQKKLAESGKKLENLTVKERKQILEAVQGQLVTEDTIKAAGNSVNGLLESLKDKLFNPSQGIFGLLKDLDDKTEGNQSVLNAFNDTLKVLIGDNGLFATIGSVLAKLGIDPNGVLIYLKRGIDGFTKWAEGLNSNLSFLNSSSSNIDELKKNIQSTISTLFSSFDFSIIGTTIANKINSVVGWASTLDFNSIFGAIGKLIADGLNGFSKTIDINKLVTLLFKGMVGFVNGVGTLLSKLTPESTDLIAKTLLIGGILPYVTATALSLAAAATPPGIAALVGIVVTKVIVDNWKGIVDNFIPWLENIGKAFTSSFNLIKDIITLNIPGIKQDVRDLIEAVRKVINEPLQTLKDTFDTLTGNKTDKDVRFEDNEQHNKQLITNRVNKAVAEGRLSKEAGAAQIRALDVPNYANGLNVGSLMSAISREQKAAPAGSNIVIANSTEAILNRQQQAQLASSVSRGGGLSIGSIVIHTAATNGKEIAETVMQHIEDQFIKFSQNNLAAAI